ncbi:MAG: cobalt transporter, inner rane subunit CbiQ [Clostridia bacterium]|nr:cobalt transporter, inner rane subunit CbiQ [Clostridia bacterium]
MSKIHTAVNDIHLLETLSKEKSFVHSIHPLAKVLVTLIYILLVMSFNKYEVNSLLSFVLYPTVLFILTDIPVLRMLKRAAIVLPIIIGVGLFNPLIDHHFYIEIGTITISSGMISLISLIIRGILAVLASFLLIATTSIEEIVYSLRRVGLPKLFALQILLTYRYIYLLLDETVIMYTAYSLRAPRTKGLAYHVWPTFLGQLILKTYKRANNLYHSMSLKGYNNHYTLPQSQKIRISDLIYLISWTMFLGYARYYSLPILLENLFLSYLH